MIRKLFTAYNLPLANFKTLFRNFYAKFKKAGQDGLTIFDISDFLITARKKNPMPDDQKSVAVERLRELVSQSQAVKFTEVY